MILYKTHPIIRPFPAMALILLLLASPGFSQQNTLDTQDIAAGIHDVSLADVHSPIYSDLLYWQEAGLIQGLPILRPYGYEQVISALKQLIAHPAAEKSEISKARLYLQKLDRKDAQYSFAFSPEIRTSSGFDGRGVYVNAPPSLGFIWNIQDSPRGETWSELHYRAHMLDSENTDALPSGMRERNDYIPDWSDIDLLGRNISIRQFVYSLLDVSRTSPDGSAVTNFRVGTHRSSAGPFHDDGILISADAAAAGHFAFNYSKELGSSGNNNFTANMNYASQLSVLSATDDVGEGRYGGKYLMFHMLRVQPAPWLSLGIIESVVWGERLELFYLIPLSSYFLNQGLTGFGDNSLLGVEAIFRPGSSVTIPLQIYADDVHFNDIMRFNFNTKYKFAAQSGISWTPLNPWLRRLSFDYTAVMPYMYTHWDERTQVFDNSRGGTANYSNYTHRGENIGPGLDPNSDRWRIDWDAAPVSGLGPLLPGLELQLSSGIRYIRHGNASQGIIEGATGDIFDPGYDGRTPTFQAPYPEEDLNGQPYTRFLTQDVIEHTLQGEIHGNLVLRPATGASSGYRGPALKLGLGYTMERIWNAELEEGRDGWNHYFQLSLNVSLP